MITTKETKFKVLLGNYNGEIVAVEVVPSGGNPEWGNYTPEVLNISFQLEDPETKDAIMHTERFVPPLTKGYGLFNKLLELNGMKDGDVDEQKFVGMTVMVTFELKKNGYSKIVDAVKSDAKITKAEGFENDVDAKKSDEPDFLK